MTRHTFLRALCLFTVLLLLPHAGASAPANAKPLRDIVITMPAETVRRRLNALIESKILIERDDGIILAADNPLGIGSRQDLWQVHARQFERLLRELRLRGISFD